MARVFLSYAREDAEKAKAFAAGLGRHGHEVWWDRVLHGGSRFASEIEAALKRADVVLVLWSRASIQSSWVQDEAAEGRDSGRLVPVSLDDIKPPLGFRQYQTVDLSAWNGRAGAPALEAVNAAVLAIAGNAADDRANHAKPAPVQEHTGLRARGRQIAAGAAVLLLAVAGLLYWFSNAPASTDAEALRVRLAGFSTLSPEVPGFVPEILREELLAALGTDAIIIASSKDARAPSEEASFEVRGSVRKLGDQLRFTTHLVDAETGDTLLTQTLDRPLASKEVGPRQVAIAVSQVLRCGLTGAAQYPKTLPNESLSLYLAYCQEYWAETAGNEMNTTRGLNLARRVTEATPDFSRGWSARAGLASMAATDRLAGAPEALRVEAVDAAQRAIRLDPRNSEAYHKKTYLLPRRAYAQREALHIKSVSVRPSDCGCEHVAYGTFLNEVGRNGEALASFKRAHDMIPQTAAANTGLAESLLVAGREEEARAVVTPFLELWPDDPAMAKVLVRSALWTGRHAEALEMLSGGKADLPVEQQTVLASVFEALQANNAQANATSRKLVQGLAKDPSADHPLLISALAALGADQEALALASSLIDRNSWSGNAVLFEPPLARGRQRPEFSTIVQRLGLSEYWQAANRLPDFCKRRVAPPLCRALRQK